MSQEASSSRVTLEMTPTHFPNNGAPRPMFEGTRIAASRNQFTQSQPIIHNTIQNNIGNDPFELLYSHVPHPGTPPGCHPNTRETFLQALHATVAQAEGSHQSTLVWIAGEAGVGKSAVMKSFSEQLGSAGKAIGHCFLSKLNPSLNTLESLVPMLAFQLILAIPETRFGVLSIISRCPWVFDMSLEVQLKTLFVAPLQYLPQTDLGPRKQFMVLVDGLDECLDKNEQVKFIRLLETMRSQNLPVTFVISSRPEPHIIR
ncbi:hypothetical protein BDN70DRAFT_935414 [Pholiota conissans]|uniref:Nephrocystin 3-like N-terminal domain-containing protein n=1 Tax=Pholiota conissans TaxID=109636 RepID=A0A9P6CWT9_9AGAR|nr:hypothetical protein BDN70DRAFT_935414 [Pholiota conissans]